MFGFLRRRREERAERLALALDELSADDKGLILDRLPNDAERRALCLRWAAEARNAWYRRRKEYIAAVVASDDPRYKQYPAEVRKSIGDQRWGRSVEAKDLASLEQMYSRWATSYAGGSGSRG